jgi:hypothetical protein
MVGGELPNFNDTYRLGDRLTGDRSRQCQKKLEWGGEWTNFNDTYKLGLLFLFLLPEEERQEDW